LRLKITVLTLEITFGTGQRHAKARFFQSGFEPATVDRVRYASIRHASLPSAPPRAAAHRTYA